MTRFNDGKISILCASDVAARGIDVKDIDPGYQLRSAPQW